MILSGKTIQYNSEEFKAVFERLYPHMYLLASRLLHSDSKGRAVAQQVFISLWEQETQEFHNESALQAFLYDLVRKSCKNRWYS